MYDDREEYIIEFYLCSLRNDFQGFCWGDMQDHFTPELQRKLDTHGQGAFGAYQEWLDDIYGDMAYLVPPEFTLKSNYTCFTAHNVVEAVQRAQYEALKDTFSDTFSHLQDYIDGMGAVDQLPLAERIELFDNIIHAQHETGDIYGDIDTEELKSAAQEMVNCVEEATP